MNEKNAKITKRAQAFTGYPSSYNVETLNFFDPEQQLKDTESAVKNKSKKNIKFMTALVLLFKKIESDDKTKYNTFHSHSKAETIINESDIDYVIESIYTTIVSNIQKYLRKSSGWIIDSVIEHDISIIKYNLLAGSS